MKLPSFSFPSGVVGSLPRLTQLFNRATAPSHPSAPHAEFATVPANRQGKVTQSLTRALAASLQGHVAPGRQGAVNELLAHVGQDDFYDTLATLDPANAAKWHDMAKVQRQFAAAEPGYDDTTRAYSQSMRLTLHAAVVQHFADPKLDQGEGLYDRFIRLHPTAFHQNGGWVDNLQIPLAGALAVVRATPPEMALHMDGLTGGSFLTDEATVKAAQLVRQARRDALSAGWGG